MNFNALGNVEFLNCFLAWHYRKFGFFKEYFGQDPRVDWYKKEFESFFVKILQGANEEMIDNALCEESKVRGLSDDFRIEPYKEMGVIEGLVFSNEVWEWKEYMETHPTYIREIEATNNLGDSRVGKNNFDFDFPVREACEILNENGYYTYWSSANREDFEKRKSHVIKDKSVAYILIDPENLTDELKEKLILNGENRFWGIAQNHSDNGKYYGIWAEITSVDMLCTDLSENLSNKALELPELVNEHNKRI